MPSRSPLLLRRSFLQILAACPAFAHSSEHFWDTDPSAWTADQIHELTTKSPWAKTVTAELKSNGSNMSSLGSNRGSGGGRSGRGGGGRGSQSTGDTSLSMPKFEGVVRWLSAKPMLAAMKMKLPDSLKGHYVIGVFGLPISAGETDPDNKDPFAALKADTTLQLKKSESAQPEVAYQDPADTSGIYFGFLPSMLNMESAKIASFSMTSGPYAVRAKFNLEEMKYHGELAV